MSLSQAFHHTIDIPNRHKCLFPDRNLPIIELLALCFPVLSVLPDVPVNGDIGNFFSPNNPSSGLTNTDLIRHPIPPLAFLTCAKQTLHDHFRKGARSFQGLSHDGSLLPLWIIPFWIQLRAIVEARNDWDRAWQWVVTRVNQKALPTHLSHMPRGLKGFFSVVGWDAKVGRFTSSQQLRRLLSDDMIEQLYVDRVLDLLREWSEHSSAPADKSVLVENTDFQFPFTYYADRPNSWQLFGSDDDEATNFQHLVKIANGVRSGAYTSIITVLHARTVNHWFAACVDLVSGQLSIGDSLDHSNHTIVTAKHALHRIDLEGYIRFANVLGVSILPDAGVLPHAHQRHDGYSCAIISLNTVERCVFPNTAPWLEEYKHALRAEYVLLLAAQSGSSFTLVRFSFITIGLILILRWLFTG